MTITLSLGWWLAPAIFTAALFLGWRLFGVRMRPNGGSMFPDVGGGIMELGGDLCAALLSLIVWLVWALLR